MSLNDAFFLNRQSENRQEFTRRRPWATAWVSFSRQKRRPRSRPSAITWRRRPPFRRGCLSSLMTVCRRKLEFPSFLRLGPSSDHKDFEWFVLPVSDNEGIRKHLCHECMNVFSKNENKTKAAFYPRVSSTDSSRANLARPPSHSKKPRQKRKALKNQ